MTDTKAKPFLVRHRRALCTILAFLAVLIGGDRLVGHAIERVVLSSQFRYSRIYRGGMDADILVVGNSRALHSVYAPDATQRLGVDVFNAAYNGISTTTVDALVRDYFEHNDPPRMVLLEITGVTVVPDGKLDEFSLFFGRSRNIRSLTEEFNPKRAFGCRASHAFRGNGPMLQRTMVYLRRDDQTWISPAARVIPRHLLQTPFDDPTPKVRPRNLEALAEIVRACEEHGVQLVPFIAPYAPGMINDHDLAADYTGVIQEAIPGFPLIVDYSQAVDQADGFVDRVHTNSRGAALLLERMIADGLFDSPTTPATGD